MQKLIKHCELHPQESFEGVAVFQSQFSSIMFLPGLSLATCLLCLSFWSKLHNKATTAIFNSSSSTSITLKEWDDVITLAIVALTWWLLVQRRTDVVETPRHRKRYAVRTPFRYAVHTPRYANDQNNTSFNRILYTMDPAIKIRSCYVHAALRSFLRRTCDVCMANRSCYERVAIFKTCSHPFVTATEGFDAMTLPRRSLGFGIRRMFASRFVNV